MIKTKGIYLNSAWIFLFVNKKNLNEFYTVVCVMSVVSSTIYGFLKLFYS